MIAQLTGIVAARGAGTAVVDVGGVGYLVHVTSHDLLPPVGEQVVLHTSLQVREDAMTLYGFLQAAARDLFELLLTASGVGPRLALAALGTHRPDVLRLAIAAEDTAALTLVPGIGKKVAQRIVLELRDKVGALGGDDVVVVVPDDASGASDAHAEIRAALSELGLGAGEVVAAMRAVDPDADTATGLRQALRAMAR